MLREMQWKRTKETKVSPGWWGRVCAAKLKNKEKKKGTPSDGQDVHLFACLQLSYHLPPPNLKYWLRKRQVNLNKSRIYKH